MTEIKTGKLTGTEVPWYDPDGTTIRGFRGAQGAKLRVCVGKWDPNGGNADDALLQPKMMSDCTSGGGHAYDNALICEKGTSIWLKIFWDPPSHGMGVSITNGDGTVFEAHRHNSSPHEQQSFEVDRYTAGRFANLALLVDNVPGLEAHGVNYLSAHKMVVHVWPITKFKDPDGTVHGPDFPPEPPKIAAMQAMASVEGGSPLQAMVSSSGVTAQQVTVTVSGGGTRGGDNVGELDSSGYTWLEEDKSPDARASIPFYIFVGTRAHIDSQVEMNPAEDGEFG